METGKVKFFNDSKSYGFIEPENGGKDVFVHYTGISGSGWKTLKNNAKVGFDRGNGPKGEQAINVVELLE